MENNLLFPSAAVLLEKSNEEQSESLSRNALDGSEFSSFTVNTPNCYRNNEEPPSWRAAASIPYDHANSSNINLCKSSSENKSSSWESDDSVEDKKKKHKKHKKKYKKKKKRRKSVEEEYCTQDCNKIDKFNSNTNKPDTIWLNETKLDPTNAFRKDSRSDQDNFEFKSLYKKDIADFYPLTYCKCLGLSKRQHITLYPEKIKRKNKKSNRPMRYFNVVKSSNDEIENNKFVNTVESEDFMPLVSSNPVKIESKDVKDITDHPGIIGLQRNKYFSQKLSENPFDIDAWLTFVDYQDELILDENKEKFNATPKAIIEKKISILEKAMLSNPLSTKLIIKYMYLVNDIWPHDRIEEQWKDVLFKIPNRGILWSHYLLYLQSDMLSMKVSSVIDAYRSAFRMLIGIYNGTVQSHPQEENVEEELLVVFLQMVLFLWQAGHTEKAVCLLQCMVEFNHFCPENLVNAEHQVKLTSFESFFEAELPRFGTFGAHGWNQDIEDSKRRKNTPSLASFSSAYTTCPEVDFEEELEKLKKNKSKKDMWLILENIRSTNEFLPFHGNHDDCEDTERIVLFDDVSFSLFHLTSSELKFQLLLAYLLLLGVPISVQLLNVKVYRCFYVYYVIKEATAVFPCFCHNPVFNDYMKIDSILLDEKKCPNHKVITEVRTIISQYLSILHTEKYIRQLSQVWFHFESSLFRYEFEKSKEFEKKYWVGMKKFIKSLLKMGANRSCVPLWSMYASYEWNIGNVSDAKKIFSTALQMSHDDKDDTIFKVAKIIRILVDIHLDWKTCDVKGSISIATKSNILNIYLAFLDSNKLLQSYDEETPNPISLFKVCNLLKNSYTSITDPIKKGDFLSCYLVFTYLYHGLVSLIQVSEEIVKSYLRNGIFVDLSETLCHALLLMRSHNTSEAFKAYKQLLEECFKVYPENENFSVLFNSLKQYGLGGYNARRFYEDTMKSGYLRPRLYAIDYEEKRMKHMTFAPSNDIEVKLEFIDAQSGIHNRIRSLYNKLLRKDIFKYCSAVWIRYLKFQLQYGSEKQANDTLYIALKNCPGVKRLYLLACDKFDEKFEEMLNLMEEKEVRVKLIVEELDILLEDNVA